MINGAEYHHKACWMQREARMQCWQRKRPRTDEEFCEGNEPEDISFVDKEKVQGRWLGPCRNSEYQGNAMNAECQMLEKEANSRIASDKNAQGPRF